MRCVLAAFAVLLRHTLAGDASAHGRTMVTPVQKVIQLLQGMMDKGKQEKHAEQVQFAAYKQFCDDTTVEKQRSIKEAAETIEVLEADIRKYKSDAAQLTKEIAGHDDDISAWSGDKTAATKVRQMEKADYDKLHEDYSESVDALHRAIEVLKTQAHDREQTPALVQVKALSLIPAEAKRAIDIFLQQGQTGIDESAPDAYGYEFQSHGVIEMLEKLLDKFVDKRTELEKTEMNTKHAFEMLIQDLDAQVTQGKQDRTDKSSTKAKKLQAKADAEGELSETKSTKEADETYLAELTSTCQQKGSDFESRQQLRSEELSALAKAVEILSSESVTGHAERYLPTLIQTAASLAQLNAHAPNLQRQRVTDFLEYQAKHLNSRVLSAIAVHAADDPFVKVKKMIKDLIVRLMEEANEEAEHKGWCDTELSTNEQTRKEKTETVEVLHAEIDQLEASIAKLTEEITELHAAVAALVKDMAEATKLRQEEKAQNELTIKDSLEAQTAVAQAMTVLREFYAKSAEAVAFVQQQPKAPPIFESPYKGMQSENDGVVGMLEVIQSDFARLEADTTASEATSQKEYDSFMTAAKVDEASKNTDIEHKEAKKQDQAQALDTKSSDLEGTQKELDTALAYFDKLKPSCVNADVSYDARVTRRKEEIESLQEALRILNGEEMASQ